MPAAEPEFCAPATLEQALAELAGGEDVIAMGGGTSVGLLLKNDLIEPRKIVWLARIPELRELTARPGRDLVIGATVTLREIAASGLIGREYPALAYAAGQVGNPRVRAIATLGGALAHSDARQDVPPVLYALEARVRIAGPSGRREVPVAGFHTGFMETVLGTGELVTGVVVPAQPPRVGAGSGLPSRYLNVTNRFLENGITLCHSCVIERTPRYDRAAAAVGPEGVSREQRSPAERLYIDASRGECASDLEPRSGFARVAARNALSGASPSGLLAPGALRRSRGAHAARPDAGASPLRPLGAGTHPAG